MKIVADSKIPFLENVFGSEVKMVFLPGNQITKKDLYETDALITRSITKCNAALLENTGIQFIATATIGDDHIDKGFCEKNNIKWVNAAGCNSGAVEQYVLAAILDFVIRNKLSLDGMTIGIIGVGHIGSRIEKMAKALGLKVLLNDTPRGEKEGYHKFSSLEKLLQQADIITIHVPLTKDGKHQTFHLADLGFFEKTKKSIMFINTSRGEVVDTKALKDAIHNQRVKYSVIDVWENEPHIDLVLLGLVDIATPHIAGYSIEGKANGTAMAIKAVSRFFNLGLDNWYPEIKSPEQTVISIECSRKDNLEIIHEMILATYDIENDDKGFRDSASDFELIRGNYPLRHEFGACLFEMNNCVNKTIELVNKLGFKTIIK
jgi:erythronate-4-phosphate dehydrogenase